MKLSIVAIGILLPYGFGGVQDVPALTPRTLAAALSAKLEGTDADRLADRIRTSFGGSETLRKGAPPKVDELSVAFTWHSDSSAGRASITTGTAGRFCRTH